MSALLQQQGRVTTLTLNRPEVHNAFDDRLIAELTQTLQQLAEDSTVQVVQLKAAGKSFSAGADLQWMQRMADFSHEENVVDAQKLATLLHTLNTLPKPTIACVQGAAFGGGVGLVACCDYVIATEAARFCFSEVKLGLIPATISPYVIAAIGPRAARRYFLTAERFDAQTAQTLGLVDDCVEDFDALTQAAETLSEQLLKNGPCAMAASKRLVESVKNRPIDQTLMAETSKLIAEARSTPEAQQRMKDFLKKS